MTPQRSMGHQNSGYATTPISTITTNERKQQLRQQVAQLMQQPDLQAEEPAIQLQAPAEQQIGQDRERVNFRISQYRNLTLIGPNSRDELPSFAAVSRLARPFAQSENQINFEVHEAS